MKKLRGTKEMDVVISNIGYNILASIIYDVSKVCLGKVYSDQSEVSISKIEDSIKDKLKDKYEMLYMSGNFNCFLQAPVFKDTIENYIIYKITGICNGNMHKVKNNNSIIKEKDVIKFLLNYLFQEYYRETLSVPSRTLVEHFFEEFFEFSTNYIFNMMKQENKMEVFLINNRIDNAEERILFRFDETIDIIRRTMNCEIISVKDTYYEDVEEYYNILKTNHSRAHVYLLDTFDFQSFYVPPLLRNLSAKQESMYHVRWLRQDHLRYSQIKNEISKDDYFDDWKYIFDNNSIVYVTGGAGYGKSLFLKKIINDYKKMNILNGSEYLVIYGDLKSFYAEGEQPVSVVKFLQDSMVKETLIDKNKLPIDMIEYYIKMGRCLILFDALDEVENPKRGELHKKIIAYFRNQNPNNKICITSRNRGFIPEKNVEVYDILPLDETQIEFYVDNIIKLGRFDAKDKKIFLEQSSVLVKKGFLNSFLVLSLLINIYKAERELPENKMELYQKCFDYIAYRREKEKTKAKFDWNLISCMMKDNTFMELARMCFPNNSDIGKSEIVEMLCNTYSGKYTSDVETERAAEHFLAFCSDRTELFVPAAGEDRFKFFHRSFFEYFYAQYIFLRIRDVEQVYDSLQKFDVDSEVFELTLAMMKQKDEARYQELVDFIFEKACDEIKKRKLSAFNILTLGMQVIDDNVYICKYMDFLENNCSHIVKCIENIPNQRIIYNIISSDEKLVNQIINAYQTYSKMKLIATFLKQFSEADEIISSKAMSHVTDEERKQYIKRNFYFGNGSAFYIRLYIKYVDYSNMLDEFSEEKLDELMKDSKISKKAKEKYMNLYKKYEALEKEKQVSLQELILSNKS